MNIPLDKDWEILLQNEFSEKYFLEILSFIEKEKLNHEVYPKSEFIFHALNLCSFEKLKVVILGQDPYHGAGQAHGLSFSVPKDCKIPPSLKNIFKEIKEDLDLNTIPQHGNLEHWASQGVLLLNAILTVNAENAASHSRAGWENFTDKIIQLINEQKEGIVFLLWGNFARKKKILIDTKKHLVLEAAHPSPLSAYNGFLGCKHFSKCNEYLKFKQKEAIDWQ